MNKKVDKILVAAKELVDTYKNTKKKIIRLNIFHEPKNYAMKRPRVGKFKNIYVPDAAKNKKDIQSAIKDQLDKQLKGGAVDYAIEIDIKYFTAIPTKFNRIERLLANKKYIRPLSKPDIDNMEKTYFDALTGVVWIDDSQIVDSRQRKYYSENPRVEIEIKFRPIHLSNKQIKKDDGNDYNN